MREWLGRKEISTTEVGFPAIGLFYAPMPISLAGFWPLGVSLFMGKLSYMQFDVYDWINDTRELSAAAKGCWIDILCLMWNGTERGRWKGTYQEFARATGTAWEEAPSIILELEKKVANVKKDNAEVTLENRRMLREDSAWKNKLNRQERYRERHKSDAKTTPIDVKDVRHETLDMRQKTTPLSEPPKPASDLPAPLATLFEKIWMIYPRRDGRKAAEKHFRASVATAQNWLDIQNALGNYLAHLSKNKTEPQFIKMGSTWFNNWQDWINYTEDTHASNDRTGPTHDDAFTQRVREAQGLRKAEFSGTAGALLHRIRNSELHENEAKESDRPKHKPDGKPLV